MSRFLTAVPTNKAEAEAQRQRIVMLLADPHLLKKTERERAVQLLKGLAKRWGTAAPDALPTQPIN